ncbi:hypothetical protein CMI37_30200 [Candidatus Pacearchaeota archaeon]|nr:hypothetical protein [Candidatus Pacearchaeota archaeon]|tara:strand:- start:507 stop:809 length:303 start_codon:yes stop_codon:yes gene_type:complete
MKVGDKAEYREDGECVVIAAKKLRHLDDDVVARKIANKVRVFYAIIVDRGENSLNRYVVCIYIDHPAYGTKAAWMAPYYTSCLVEAATEYNALTTNNKED